MSEFQKKLGAWGGIFGGIQFIIITFGIMIIYPEGYDFLLNTFSSLGLTVTKGYATPINHALFSIACSVVAGCAVMFWLTMRTVFNETTPQKIVSSIGTILGVVASPFVAALAIFAADVYPMEHGWSTILFFLIFALAITTYSFAILLNKNYENLYAAIGFVVALICVLYITVIGGAAFQKVAVYSLILYSGFQGYKLLKVFGAENTTTQI